MELDWIKVIPSPGEAAKHSDPTNLTRHFQGGSPPSQGGMAPQFKYSGNNFNMTGQGTLS